MERRSFLRSGGMGAVALAAISRAALPVTSAPMKITRVRFYHNPNSAPIFNQSAHIVTVETDQGITGIGEGARRPAQHVKYIVNDSYILYLGQAQAPSSSTSPSGSGDFTSPETSRA